MLAIEDEKIRIAIPLHFKGESVSPGVKKGGVVSHLKNEVAVTCLPKDLPDEVREPKSEAQAGGEVALLRFLPAGQPAQAPLQPEQHQAGLARAGEGG